MLSLDEILTVPPPPLSLGDGCHQSGCSRLARRYKYRISRMLRPSMILGLGVGNGEAASMLLAGSSKARYVGLDIRVEDDPSLDTLDETARWLRDQYPKAWVELYRWTALDSETRLTRHYPSAFDLVHVDSGSDERQCLRDLNLAEAVVRTGGYILLDHYGDIPRVREAAEYFLLSAATGFEWLHIPSPTGDLLLQKPQVALWRGATGREERRRLPIGMSPIA